MQQRDAGKGGGGGDIEAFRRVFLCACGDPFCYLDISAMVERSHIQDDILKAQQYSTFSSCYYRYQQYHNPVHAFYICRALGSGVKKESKISKIASLHHVVSCCMQDEGWVRVRGRLGPFAVLNIIKVCVCVCLL